MINKNTTEAVEVLQEWRDENGRVDLDAVRSGTVDIRHQDAIWAALLDEVEQLRGPGKCPASGAPCRPKGCTYGTTAASLGDYDHKHGDAGAETYLARCVHCGTPFVGITPAGVFPDEPGFAGRVRWIHVEGGES